MRHIFIVFKWEFKKIVSNWRRAVAVFMLPAAMLLLALNAFPILVHYLNTGELSQRPKIVAVEAPESFKDFTEDSRRAKLFKYEWMSADEFYSNNLDDVSVIQDRMLDGSLFLFFQSSGDSVNNDFDQVLSEYFAGTAANKRLDLGEYCSGASMTVMYNWDISTGRGRAEQFLLTIEDEYKEFIYDNYGKAYTDIGGGSRWQNNKFNPIMYVIENRTYANAAVSRVMPPILLILIYYSVYSLTCEILASERERGFLTKLYLSPISASSLLIGKMLTIVVLSTFISLLTYVLLFLSSWANRTNSPESLIPFGLFLTPTELLLCMIVVISMAFIVCACCFDITLTIPKLSDIMVALQKPLIICIFEFFVFLFRPTRGVFIEYLIPIHNGVVVMQDVFCQRVSASRFICCILINLVIGVCLFAICLRKKEGMIHILGGDSNDRSK